MKVRDSQRIFWLMAVTAFLAACGEGGYNGTVSQLPPSIRYPTTSGFVVGAGITPLRPVISGHVSGFGVTPDLPPGLTIDFNNGTIIGTPTAPVPSTTYTVAANSESGSVATTVTLVVVDQVPVLSFSQNTWAFTQNTAIAGITPTLRGGPVVTWTIDRALPAGLDFDTSNGHISGTPTVASPQTNYLVTARNTGGASSATLTITVQAAPSGNARPAYEATLGTEFQGAALRVGARALSLDSSGHGALWNARTGATLATFDDVVDSDGRVTCALNNANCLRFLSLAGNTAVVWSGNRLRVLDSVSGARLTDIEVPAAIRWWQLARDGSYVVAATDAQLAVWSRSGAVLFTQAANYASARAFAAAGELRIGAGPAGAHVIETILLPAGVASISVAHRGSFQSWSDDGEQFVATTGASVWIYSRDAARLETARPATGL